MKKQKYGWVAVNRKFYVYDKRTGRIFLQRFKDENSVKREVERLNKVL